MLPIKQLTKLEMFRTVEAFRRVEAWASERLPSGRSVRAWRSSEGAEAFTKENWRTCLDTFGPSQVKAREALTASLAAQSLTTTFARITGDPSWSRSPSAMTELRRVTETVVGPQNSPTAMQLALAQARLRLYSVERNRDSCPSSAGCIQGRAKAIATLRRLQPLGTLLHQLEAAYADPHCQRALYPPYATASGPYTFSVARTDLGRVASLLVMAVRAGASIASGAIVRAFTAPLTLLGLFGRAPDAQPETQGGGRFFGEDVPAGATIAAPSDPNTPGEPLSLRTSSGRPMDLSSFLLGELAPMPMGSASAESSTAASAASLLDSPLPALPLSPGPSIFGSRWPSLPPSLPSSRSSSPPLTPPKSPELMPSPTSWSSSHSTPESSPASTPMSTSDKFDLTGLPKRPSKPAKQVAAVHAEWVVARRRPPPFFWSHRVLLRHSVDVGAYLLRGLLPFSRTRA